MAKPTSEGAAPRSRPPAIGRLLETPEIQHLVAEHGRQTVLAVLRPLVAELRLGGAEGRVPEVGESLGEMARARLQGSPRRLRRVINGTGVLVHTNLGRVPISRSAAERAAALAVGYSNLELNLDDGRRGHRQQLLRTLLCELGGSQSALVVNNGAAALLLALTALCSRREVLVSRGEAIEIGGGFRIPDILRLSGARLVDVGTTNRTRVGDYVESSNPRTAAYLRVHHSNFRIEGFASRPPLSELVEAAHSRGLLLLEDVGSGLLPAQERHLHSEQRVKDSIAQGVDLVVASGDKLVGASQAGLVFGRSELVDRLERHPMARALRPDKLQLVALEETLRLHASPEGRSQIPLWRMLETSQEELRIRVQRWQAGLERLGISAQAIAVESAVGGGITPGPRLPSAGLLVNFRPSAGLRRALLQTGLPLLALERDEGIVIDARTVLEDEEELVVPSIEAALSRARGG